MNYKDEAYCMLEAKVVDAVLHATSLEDSAAQLNALREEYGVDNVHIALLEVTHAFKHESTHPLANIDISRDSRYRYDEALRARSAQADKDLRDVQCSVYYASNRTDLPPICALWAATDFALNRNFVRASTLINYGRQPGNADHYTTEFTEKTAGQIAHMLSDKLAAGFYLLATGKTFERKFELPTYVDDVLNCYY